MAEFPALPLWTDAYLADTGHLTTAEHGAYLLLLITMWRAGGKLPNDDKRLCRYSKLSASNWSKMRDTIMEFFTIDGDVIRQNRLSDELDFVKARSRKQSENARSKSRKTKETKQAMAKPNASQTSAPIPTPISSLRSDGKAPPAESPKKRAIPLPKDFEPDLQAAVDEGLQPQTAILSLTRFKDHAQANGRTQIDWMASWRLWYRNDIAKQKQPRGSPSRAEPRQHPVIEELDRRRDLRNAELNHSRIIDHER